ncbi:hypothetical protein SAMN02745866_01292 [Alteromonadaceae bacterium Bs31]|nr:hypothetical protein SAMN02745866_01292 [Alteromonadaceae bacterium Bs31]
MSGYYSPEYRPPPKDRLCRHSCFKHALNGLIDLPVHPDIFGYLRLVLAVLTLFLAAD